MTRYPDQDVADNRRSVRRRVRQLEQRQRRALREQGQQLLERAGRATGAGHSSGRRRSPFFLSSMTSQNIDFQA